MTHSGSEAICQLAGCFPLCLRRVSRCMPRTLTHRELLVVAALPTRDDADLDHRWGEGASDRFGVSKSGMWSDRISLPGQSAGPAVFKAGCDERAAGIRQDGRCGLHAGTALAGHLYGALYMQGGNGQVS